MKTLTLQTHHFNVTTKGAPEGKVLLTCSVVADHGSKEYEILMAAILANYQVKLTIQAANEVYKIASTQITGVWKVSMPIRDGNGWKFKLESNC